jgi:hypothetical protein
MMNALAPTRILEVGMGFWPSKVLLSAVELGVFATLGNRTMTGRELVDALKLHTRANPDFFDALVALKFLSREGEGSGAQYRNSAEALAFLDRNSDSYMGGLLEMASARLYRFWGDLTEALQTGRPQNEVKHSGQPMFTELYSDPKRLEQFMDGFFARGQFMQAFHGRPIVIGIPSAIGVAGSMACGLAPKRFRARVGYSRFAGDPGKNLRTLHHDVFLF